MEQGDEQARNAGGAEGFERDLGRNVNSMERYIRVFFCLSSCLIPFKHYGVYTYLLHNIRIRWNVWYEIAMGLICSEGNATNGIFQTAVVKSSWS